MVPIDFEAIGVGIRIGQPGDQVWDLALEVSEMFDVRCPTGKIRDDGDP
jgi:hypothetical protein